MATMQVLARIQGEKFTGFPEGAFDFFTKLARNNDREWFAKRKTVYEDTLLAPMLLLVQELAHSVHAKGLPIEPSRKSPVQRIYRDIRFSPNKAPFQTHISSALYRDGDKNSDGVLYLHLDAKQPFIAAGFWQPEKNRLRRWREDIAADPKPLLKIAKKLPLDEQERLQRMPRGYERFADTEAAPLLRSKSFIVRRDLPQSELFSRAILKRLTQFAKEAEPLLRHGWALEESPDQPGEA